jgi:hypothetical protein
MKIYTPIGSKERLVEIFQGVNKVKLKLNEGSNTANETAIVTSIVEQLKSGQITVKKTESQASEGSSFVVLTCGDANNNISKLTFKTQTQEGEQEGVFNVGGTQLMQFAYRSADGSQVIDLNEEDLQEFNTQHQGDLTGIVEKYVDVESPTDEPTDELYEEAIKKIDSAPFGGTKQKMVTNKEYADQKPTNSKLRVNAPELQKIAETIKKIDSQPFGGDMEKMVTNKEYADQKPTNPAVRVKAPELTKIAEDANSLLHFSQAARDKGSNFKTKLAVSYQYVLVDALKAIGIEVQNIEDIDDRRYRITATYQGEPRTFIVDGQKFNNAAKVRELLKKALKIGVSEEVLGEPKPINPSTKSPVDDLPPAKKKIIMSAIDNLTYKRGRREYAPSAAEINAEIMRMQSAGEVPQYDSIKEDYSDDELPTPEVRYNPDAEPEDSTDTMVAEPEEPVAEIPEEKKQEIYKAYDAILARKGQNYAPTTEEIMIEINGSKPKQKTRVFPKEAEPFLEQQELPKEPSPFIRQVADTAEKAMIIQAAANVKQRLMGKKVSLDEFKVLVKAEANKIFNERRLAVSNESVDEMALLRNVDKISPEKYKAVLVHLWDSGTSGTKVCVFVPQNGEWVLRQQKGVVFTDQSTLDRPDIAYIQGQAAKEFLRQRGYKIDDTRKLPVKVGGSAPVPVAPVVPPAPATMNEDEMTYPDPLGKEFKTKDLYPKKKKKHSKKVKLSENDNEEPEDDEQISHQPFDDEESQNGEEVPEKSIDPPASKMNGENDGMSLEPESDEVEQLAQDKEETGDMLQGGLGDEKSPLEFDPDQVLKGLSVEMEHSDNPMIALEIALDHLTEIPDYYDRLEKMEADAKENGAGSTDPMNPSGCLPMNVLPPMPSDDDSEKSKEDILLGFQPKNVGDYASAEPVNNEVPEEQSEETPEEKPEEQPEEEPEEEDENKLNEENERINAIITEEQIKTAKLTISNRNIPTGMSKKEAVEILMKKNLKQIL